MESGKGLASNVEDATAEGLKDLAEKLAPKILDKVASYIQGNVKKIFVKVNGVADRDKTVLDAAGFAGSVNWQG